MAPRRELLEPIFYKLKIDEIMNIRYQQLQVTPGTYVPNVGIDYPEQNPVERLHRPIYDRNVVVDEHYPFVDDSFRYRLHRWFNYTFTMYTAVNIFMRIKFGLRYEGREFLKKYKKELQAGAITLGNHVYPLDAPTIIMGVHGNRHTMIPMFAPNFSTKDNYFLTAVGGIPIPEPEAGLSALKKFNEAFDEFHRRGYWFHIFPEAARWDFYKPLRPFKKGAFTMAYKYGMPLIPCVITYRERTGIYRLFGKKELPLWTVRYGEPIIPNLSAPRKVEVERLRETAHRTMQELAGITSNPWPIVPQDE